MTHDQLINRLYKLVAKFESQARAADNLARGVFTYHEGCAAALSDAARDLDFLLGEFNPESTMDWQPIGTAPKDTQVVAWCSDHFGYGDQGECVIAMLNSKENHWETFHEGTSLNTPTHWMHLPESPEPHGAA